MKANPTMQLLAALAGTNEDLRRYLMPRAIYPKGTVITSRDGKEKGQATGTVRRCMLEGCGGIRIGVRWPDGKLTWPCSVAINDKRIQ
jgi:hypothetical protein